MIKQRIHQHLLNLLVDLLLVRRLPSWHGNTGKRLSKAPKILIRDSGIVHALLNIANQESLLGHLGDDRYPIGHDIEVIGFNHLARELAVQ